MLKGGITLATIIAAHDISGVGRCSLSTALAVLPALGHTCYPMPTAVLSQQTGFPQYSFVDFTQYMPKFLDGWRSLAVSPDMIYTGFLGNGRQTELLSKLISEHPGALAVVDPVMGDNGAMYGCYDKSFADDMRILAKSAHILLPNMTEFCLLTGKSLEDGLDLPIEEILPLALQIDAPRLKSIVITSFKRGDKTGGMCNLLIDVAAKAVTELPCGHYSVSYSGSGDLFASVICGLVANGVKLDKAVEKSAGFVSTAANAMPDGADTRFGIRYEHLLAKFAVSEGIIS